MALSIAALIVSAQAPQVTLSYFQEHFIVRDGVYNESAPLKIPPGSPRLSVAFRRDAAFAVWDERGLTIRVGKKLQSTKFRDVATSPKAFTKEEIKRTLSEIKAGRRSRDVGGLSGAVRIGSSVYFLARWTQKDGTPWAEAILRADLSEKFPEPKFLGRIPALSLAARPIDDQLFILEGKPSYVARTGAKWGLAQIDLKSKNISLDVLGGQLIGYTPIEGSVLGSRLGLFVERTAYGTTVAGRVDLVNRYRKPLAEARAAMRFIDARDPACVVISFGDTAVLHNTATGAEMALPVPCATRRLSRGVVVWTPVSEPKRAWLFDPQRWQVRAYWPPTGGVERP